MERLPFTGSSALISAHPEMLRIFKEIRGVLARNGIPLLFIGETGTGKDLFAQSVHYLSARRNSPFLVVNCGAISKDLIESELFGHAKGSFTGADCNRKGYFEEAKGGTLFLDEIGELPLDAQVKLLRVLQEGKLSKVGSSKIVKTDVRIVAATNCDLESMVKMGTFREDLYYRIAKYPLQLLPLRERKMDIPLLADEFMRIFSTGAEKKITSINPQTLSIFKKYTWPGNVRELESTIEIAIAFHPGGRYRAIHHRYFPLRLMRKFGLRKSVCPIPRPRPGQVKHEILEALALSGKRSVNDLAQIIAHSKSTIKDNLRTLERAGKIHVEHRPGRSGNLIHLVQRISKESNK